MEKLHTRLACLGLMFGSGAACAAVQAGDGAVRARHDVLANLAHDPACVEQLAAAGAAAPSSPVTASAQAPRTTVSDTVTHAGQRYIAPDAIAFDKLSPARPESMSSAGRPGDDDVARHIAPDVVAMQMDTPHIDAGASRAPIGTASANAASNTAPGASSASVDDGVAGAPRAAADSPDDVTSAVRSHSVTRTHLGGSRLNEPPSPNRIASLGRVTIGASDNDTSAVATPVANVTGVGPASDTSTAARVAAGAPLPGIVIEPAGAVVAKATPLDLGRGPDVPSLPRTTDPLPLATANATSSRTGWTLGGPASRTSDPDRTNDPASGRKADSPRAADTRHDASDGWTEMKISDTQLDQMRGGFDAGAGLQIAFGIERAVFINGQLVATTSFNIPNLAQITPAQAQMLAQTLNTATVIQSGPGNIAPASLPGASAATIVQNTLNNQQIGALTTVNAAVNTLAQFKASNLQATIRSAVANTVTPR